VLIGSEIAASPALFPRIAATAGIEPNWYALHTRAQHEKSVISHLQGQGLTSYLPLVDEVHQWSDRRKHVQVPLFSCYVFVHMPLVPETWNRVMRTAGALRLVGPGWDATPIAESEIEGIRTLLSSKLPYGVHPFIKVGQRVRVRGGSLDGIEGTLTAYNGKRTLMISIEAVQRSLSVNIDSYSVEPA
jgi:transcription antitermination factor NusG